MSIIWVIIPVYNCSKYIEEAVRSVLNQPESVTQIILVDDGSTDGSAVACDRLSELYDVVTVIHKENGGVSSARNAGIEYVLEREEKENSYVAFLDADDAWEVGFLNKKIIEKLGESYDLLGFQSCTCNAQMKQTSIPRVMNEGVWSGGEANSWLHSGQHFAGMFYSIKILRNYSVRFLRVKYSEDKIFSMQCMYLADSIYLENRLMYLYRIIASSAMGTRNFGIPYYRPIVEAYLESDREMEVWANEKRGELKAGRQMANLYVMDMVDEHYLTFGSHQSLKTLFEMNSGLLEVVSGTGAYHMIGAEPRYLQYISNPQKYIMKKYIRGVPFAMKRLLRRIRKLFA